MTPEQIEAELLKMFPEPSENCTIEAFRYWEAGIEYARKVLERLEPVTYFNKKPFTFRLKEIP